MSLPDPHPIEIALRTVSSNRDEYALRLIAADWLREVACLLWDNLPDCEQCGGHREIAVATTNPKHTGLTTCPSCHGTGKPDPAEHLRGMIALWAAVHGSDAMGFPLDDYRDYLRQIGGTP